MFPERGVMWWLGVCVTFRLFGNFRVSHYVNIFISLRSSVRRVGSVSIFAKSSENQSPDEPDQVADDAVEDDVERKLHDDSDERVAGDEVEYREDTGDGEGGDERPIAGGFRRCGYGLFHARLLLRS